MIVKLAALFRSVIIAVTISHLALGGVWAQADDSSTALPIEAPYPVSDAEPIDQIEKQAVKESEAGKAWASRHEAAMETVLDMQVRAFEHYENLKSQLGEEKVNELVERSEVVVQLPGVAKAEVNFVDKQLFVRVVMEKSGVAYLLLDQDKVEPTSKHLRQIISRQHIEAGENRIVYDERGQEVLGLTGKPKRTTGRDVVEVWLSANQDHPNIKENPKSAIWKARFWKDYFFAKYKKPSWKFNDVTLTLFTGVIMQGALTAAFSAMKSSITGDPMNWAPVVFTAVYGGIIGTFYSTYKNFVNSGSSRLRRTLKGNSVSALYGYVMTVLTGGKELGAISLMTPEGRAMNVSLWANFTMNNYAKDPWAQIPANKTRLREYVKPIRFKIFGKQVEWNRSNFMGQMYYMIPWSLNVFTLMGQVPVNIPGTHFRVPILQLLSIPIAQFILMKYLDRTIDELKDIPHLQPKVQELREARARLGETWGMDLKDVPSAFVEWTADTYRSVKTATKKMTQSVIEVCSGFISRLNQPIFGGN
ncbi:MAG: hypothetical protein IT289_00685 [Oligoflexia bacterium]|nr:hypothetical protein [Oligoflexia bacterium]